jgi:uncharacterized membrane protein
MLTLKHYNIQCWIYKWHGTEEMDIVIKTAIGVFIAVILPAMVHIAYMKFVIIEAIRSFERIANRQVMHGKYTFRKIR